MTPLRAWSDIVAGAILSWDGDDGPDLYLVTHVGPRSSRLAQRVVRFVHLATGEVHLRVGEVISGRIHVLRPAGRRQGRGPEEGEGSRGA